jgi:hypothetical protein
MGILRRLFAAYFGVGLETTHRRPGSADSGRLVTCYQCGCAMLIISNATVRAETFRTSQGCFKCASCGQYFCYEHSNRLVPCNCGAKQWLQRTYISDSGHVSLLAGALSKFRREHANFIRIAQSGFDLARLSQNEVLF